MTWRCVGGWLSVGCRCLATLFTPAGICISYGDTFFASNIIIRDYLIHEVKVTKIINVKGSEKSRLHYY